VEAKIEGPFGEYHGYYASGASLEPVIRVKSLLHRDDPIIQGNPPMKPPLAHFGAPINHAAIWNQMEKSLPGVKAVYAHPAGGGGHIYVATIEQKYAGHAKQTGILLAGNGRTVRYVVVTDDDIDPSNMEEVMWAVATRADPATAISIIGDMPSSALDPILHPSKKSRPESMANSRAIINACRPYEWFEAFPVLNKASQGQRRKTLEKWNKLFAQIH
jgi:4-hydroxy-3-polyprenylbenzoate decarboxylase